MKKKNCDSKEEIPAKMTFGIQPTCWTNDDFPEIGNKTPYQRILEETKLAGFAGGSTGHNYPGHLESLLESMGSLKIASTWAGTAFTTGVDADLAFQAFQAQVTFLKNVGAHDVVVAELANAVNTIRTKPVLTERPILNEPQWFLLTTLLDKAGKYAKGQGMQLSYHPHVGTGVITLDETERLLADTNRDYVGLCLDTAHLRFGGASQKEIVDLTKRHVDRITHVHLKSVRPKILKDAINKKYSFYQAIQHGIFTVPGDTGGELEYLGLIVNILQKNSYNRWMVIEAEQNSTNPDPVTHKHVAPLEYARTARAFLLDHLGY